MTAGQSYPHGAGPADVRAIQTKASGSSFYAAMRLMAKPERDAMFAIYAFCRAVDDIADDGQGTRSERLAALNEWRDSIEAVYRGKAAPLAQFLAGAIARHRLDKRDFLAVIDGMQMDAIEDIRAPTLQTLDLYCDRVASAVGRLCVKVFGMDAEPGLRLANHLGRALQLTNVLRDIDEDAACGRLYLPREFLLQAGVPGGTPAEAIEDERIDGTCRLVAEIAHRHYEEAETVLTSKPQGRLRAPRLMHAVYLNILGKMESRGWLPPRKPVRLGKGERFFILLRHGLLG